MPPRYVYWTILIDGKATAFRARERDELLPTFNQLARKNSDIAMKYFSRGKLWDSPEQAEWASKSLPAPREKRNRDWRPGGTHQDPRARFENGKGSKPAGDRPVSTRSPSTRPLSDRPASTRPPDARPFSDRPTGARPFSDRPTGARPVSDRPTSIRLPRPLPSGSTGESSRGPAERHSKKTWSGGKPQKPR